MKTLTLIKLKLMFNLVSVSLTSLDFAVKGRTNAIIFILQNRFCNKSICRTSTNFEKQNIRKILKLF